MKTVRACVAIVMLAFSHAASSGARCQGSDGEWYDYGHPKCSPGRGGGAGYNWRREVESQRQSDRDRSQKDFTRDAGTFVKCYVSDVAGVKAEVVYLPLVGKTLAINLEARRIANSKGWEDPRGTLSPDTIAKLTAEGLRKCREQASADDQARKDAAAERKRAVNSLIAQRDIARGMTQGEVRQSLGNPNTTRRASLEELQQGFSEVWFYDSYRGTLSVSFDAAGKVSSYRRLD